MAHAPPAIHDDTPRDTRRAGPRAWRRWLIRVRAYFLKEVNEIRRQPLLVLSLIVGPLLVLILFGSTYVRSTPLVRTAVVLPPGGVAGISEEQIRTLIGNNFAIRMITEDRAEADALLAAGELDLVQVLPANVADALRGEVNPQIIFISNAINPLTEGWIQYLAYAEINEVNKAILRATTEQAQREAAAIRVRLIDADGLAAELQASIDRAEQAGVRERLRIAIDALILLESALPAREILASQGGELALLHERVAALRMTLVTIERAVADGTLKERLAELANARQELRAVNGTIELFINTSPDRLISPVSQSYSNIRGGAFSAVAYYSPGVLALLVQHTAITLGALALVRERLMGAFEVFRVAPVSLTQLMIGKYMGYTLFISLATLVLIVAMTLIGVPLPASWPLFAAMLLLLIVASLGVGFLISSLSGSDSQAIQLAMISLLLSIFFSGFFIALESFAWPALPVSYSIPMTHGLAGFQHLMLRGIAPPPWTWVGLSAIAAVTFLLVVLITRRQLRRA
jgi:ABC-2 type transport system permease protein